jgi:hypothetical protein
MNYMPRYCISTGTDIFLTAEVINLDCIEIAVGNKDRINKIPFIYNSSRCAYFSSVASDNQ